MVCCYQQGRSWQHHAWHSEGTNSDCYAEIYYKMRMVEPKAEEEILRSFTRTSSHAAHQHSEHTHTLARSSPVCLTKPQQLCPVLCLALLKDSYVDEKFHGVLVETSSSEKKSEESVLGLLRQQATEGAFALFLGECLHLVSACIRSI